MDEIVLDKKTFGALAIDTRVNIMKALKERRKTQSELSKELALAQSTISEHLEKMLDAGLIARKQDHHKWIYYELTVKGLQIISPQRTSVFVFALSLILFVAAFGYMFLNSTTSASASAPTLGEQAVSAASEKSTSMAQGTDYILLSLLGTGVFFLLLSAYYRLRKQRAVDY